MLGQPRRKSLTDLDNAKGLTVSIAEANALFKLFKEYTKPHDYQIRNSNIILGGGLVAVAAALALGGASLLSSSAHPCKDAKQGSAIVLAALSAVAGFVGGGFTKP
jgi:hypothetical protein